MAKNMIRRPFPRGGIRTRLPVTIYRRSSDDFSPTEIEGLALWLDGADSSSASMTLVDGKVSTWFDKSGSGNNATQDTGANRPTLTGNGQKGRSVLTFPGSPVRLGTSLSLGSPFTVVAVVKQTARALAPYLGPTTSSHLGLGDVFVVSTSTDFNNGKWSAWGGSRAVYGNNDAPVSLTPSVVETVVSGSSFPQDISIFANGAGGVATAQTAGIAPDMPVDSLFIGARSPTTPGAEFFVGWIGEILIYNRALTASERLRARQGMFGKWGISP